MKVALCFLSFAGVIMTMLSGVDQVEGWLFCLPKVDCEWTPWGSWSTCSSTCGPLGSRERTRLPVWPSECHGDSCVGSGKMTTYCNRFCLNGGDLIDNECVCDDDWEGTCCEDRRIDVSVVTLKVLKYLER